MTIRRLLIIAVLASGAGVLSAVPAFAHAAFVSSQPEPGDTLSATPGVVILAFSEPLNTALSRAAVTDPAGRVFAAEATHEREIRVPLSTNVPGVYAVRWVTVSTVDGHTLRGRFSFGVGVQPGADAEGGVSAAPGPTDLLIAVARVVEYLGLLVAVGTIVLTRIARRPPALGWSSPMLVTPLAVALAGGVAVVVGEGLVASSGWSLSAFWSYVLVFPGSPSASHPEPLPETTAAPVRSASVGSVDSPSVTPGQRAALRAHLLHTGLAGETRTTRENSVSNAERLAAGDPDKALGIGSRGRDALAVMQAVAALCGCSPRLDERTGGGVIDPDRTLDALQALADRLATATRRRQRVLIATGHPTGLLAMYQSIAGALTRAGATIPTPLEDQRLDPPYRARRRRTIRYLDGVAVLAVGADLAHTHESWPMELLLDAIDPPDLVLADHGWAGAAIMRNLETACFTDVNDPALAVAKADGLVDIVVPLDDNLPPSVYNPLRDYLLTRMA